MAHIQWKDRYNIHFREIDAQHHGLLDLLNELIDLMDGGKNTEQVEVIFHNLAAYAVTHFSSEERYMQAAGYPKLAAHSREHEVFTARVLELSQAYDPGDPQLVEETLDFLKHWYLEHITKMDQDYVPFLKRALPTAPIEGILFGLEGMTCAFTPAPLLSLLSARCGKPEAEAQAALWADPGFLTNLESGTSDPQAFCTDLGRWAGQALAPEELATTYLSCYRGTPALIHLATRLKAHQPVALVGNAAPWWRSQGLAESGLTACFNAEVFSCEVGKRLPDPAPFLEAARRLGRAPETCLLIHPDPACLAEAQAAEMQTLHYTNPVMLMAELRHMGVAF